MNGRRSWLIDRIRAGLGYRFPPLGQHGYRAVTQALPRRVDVELFPGVALELDLDDETQCVTFWQGARFEHPTPRVLAEWGRNADAFFDIGANYGFYSYWMMSRCPRLTVHAFDPTPAHAELMQAVRKRNRLEQFHIHGVALGDRHARLPLHLGSTDSGHSTFGQHPGLTGASIEVDVIPFDTWRPSTGLELPASPRWIAKIDVEGYELNVLKGMETALRAQAFAGLAVEVNRFTLGLFGLTERDIDEFLAACRYVRAPGIDTGCARSPGCYNAFFIPARVENQTAVAAGRSPEG